jgi:hypothetical protein
MEHQKTTGLFSVRWAALLFLLAMLIGKLMDDKVIPLDHGPRPI